MRLVSDQVKSTDDFTEKISVKVILLGQSNAGKTSLLQTVKEQHSVLMPEGATGRTVGIELTVFNVHVHPDICCFVYDFGGQEVYYPLHQAMITPHSLFCLVVDLFSFFQNIANEKAFNADIRYFYFSVYQRVHSPVLQVIGTKSDLLSEGQIQDCSDKIIKGLFEIEESEMEILEIRKRELLDAKKFSSSQILETTKFKFRGLSLSELDEKIKEVEEQMSKDKRPKLPSEVIVVSSKTFTGIGKWTDDIAQKIFQYKELFPSMNIPRTWLHLSESLNDNKNEGEIILNRGQFSDKCKTFNITSQEEIQMLTHHLRVVGKLLQYENHPKLKDIVFTNPDAILNALSAVFNHEHFVEEFWTSNKTMTKLPKSTQKLHRRHFLEYGITSKTVMHSFMKEKGVHSNFEELIELMFQIDLCFQLSHGETNRKLLNEDCYIIPSLLKSQPTGEMVKMWPETANKNVNEIKASLSLIAGCEPSGLFEKLTTRINHHLKRRCDISKCTVGEINNLGDTFRLEMETENTNPGNQNVLLSVRHGFGRHRIAANFLKVFITRMINILSNYPNVLWDFFTLCTPCVTSEKQDCELLPAEACIFSVDKSKSLHKCDECNTEFDFATGFPISKGKQHFLHSYI